MYINLLLIIILVYMICNYLIIMGQNKCISKTNNIKYIRASKLSTVIKPEHMKLAGINIKFDRDVSCGIYNITTLYGSGVLIVGKDNNTGFLHINDMTVIKDINMFDIWDIEKLESGVSFIKTYNTGCC